MPDAAIVMLGAGGHARVLQESLSLVGVALAGFVSPDAAGRLVDVEYWGDDDAVLAMGSGTVILVNGIGSVGAVALRASAYERAIRAGFSFLTIVDPDAIVRPSAIIGQGAQILAGAIVNTGAVVGANSIVNSGAIVEHDCHLGQSVHLSPGAVLGGGVSVGDRSHIGLGARVLQAVSIGSDCTIGAGAVVTRDVPDGMIAVGVPAVARPRGEAKAEPRGEAKG